MSASKHALKHSQSQTQSLASSQSQPRRTSNVSMNLAPSSSTKLNRTSVVASQQSVKQHRSSNPLNSSSLSLNLTKKTLKTSSSSSSSSAAATTMPPNPYHVVTKRIPVSAQDSEIQSVVSSDNQFEDAKSSVPMFHLPKIAKQIKQSIKANKNVKVNMPEFKLIQPQDTANDMTMVASHLNESESHQPVKGRLDSKKVMQPLSERNPKQFADELINRLEKIATDVASGNESKAKSTSSSRLNIGAYSKQINEEININFSNKLDYIDNIESQLDEHLNLIDKTYSNNKRGKRSPRVKQNNTMNMTELTGSFISSMDHHLNHNHQNQMNHSSNYSFNSKLPINVAYGGSRPKRSLNPYETNSAHNQHHFYQPTSTSKEFDIDERGQMHLSSIANNRADSGVASAASANSIERVSDWLKCSSNESAHQQQQSTAPMYTQANAPTKTGERELKGDSTKTTVAYYLPGEDLAYISTFNGKWLTLAQFKQLITKKGNFRYFFKTKSDLLDEECVVFQEATDESACVPMFNNKVIAKIEKIK